MAGDGRARRASGPGRISTDRGGPAAARRASAAAMAEAADRLRGIRDEFELELVRDPASILRHAMAAGTGDLGLADARGLGRVLATLPEPRLVLAGVVPLGLGEVTRFAGFDRGVAHVFSGREADQGALSEFKALARHAAEACERFSDLHEGGYRPFTKPAFLRPEGLTWTG